MKAIVRTNGYTYVRDLFSYPGKMYALTKREYKLLTRGDYTIANQEAIG